MVDKDAYVSDQRGGKSTAIINRNNDGIRITIMSIINIEVITIVADYKQIIVKTICKSRFETDAILLMFAEESHLFQSAGNIALISIAFTSISL